MFNSFLLNTNTLNTNYQGGNTSVSLGVFVYNGYDFSNSNFVLSELQNIESSPDIQLATYDRAKEHGVGLYTRLFKEKKFALRGTIKAGGGYTLQEAINILKQKMSKINGDFSYIANEIIYTGRATVSEIEIKREHYHLDIADVTIEFVMHNPFRLGDLRNSNTYGVTSNITYAVENSHGNFEAYPLIVLTFNSASSVSQFSFRIGLDEITLTQPVSAGDLFIINSSPDSLDVTKAGVGGQNYTGSFPRLGIGANEVERTCNGTFNTDISIIWKDTYI